MPIGPMGTIFRFRRRWRCLGAVASDGLPKSSWRRANPKETNPIWPRPFTVACSLVVPPAPRPRRRFERLRTNCYCTVLPLYCPCTYVMCVVVLLLRCSLCGSMANGDERRRRGCIAAAFGARSRSKKRI